MKTYATNYDSWLSQLHYYIVTSIPLTGPIESYHDLDKDYWWPYYDMGLTAREAVKVYQGWMR